MIIDYIPDGVEIYVEPFIGSGAVYWRKEPHPRDVINDLDRQLIADYRLLKSASPTTKFRTDLDSVPELQRFLDRPARSDADRLTQGIVGRCNRWMGRDTGDVYNDSNPYNKLKNLAAYQDRMRNTTILNQSYEKVLQKYDSPTTFFYLDPPYVKPRGTEGELYSHDVEGIDFADMEQRLRKLKGKWLLSINDTPEIRAIFKGYRFKAFTVKAKNSVPGTIGSKPRKELLISNFGG